MLTRRPFSLLMAFIACAIAANNAAAQPMLINPAMNSVPAEMGPIAPVNTTLSGNATVAPATGPAAPSLSEKRAANSDQLRIAMRKLETAGPTDPAATKEVAYFQMREALLTQQDTVERLIKDLQSRKTDLEKFLNTPRVDDKQYKFADLDQMKDDLAAEQAKSTFAADKLANAKSALEVAQATVDDCESKRARAQTAYEGAKDAPNASELAAVADQARKDALLANETLALRKREVDREVLSQEVLGLITRLRQEKIARVSPLITFTEADLKEQLDSIKKSVASNESTLAQAQLNSSSAESEFQASKAQFEVATEANKQILLEAMIARRMYSTKLMEECESASQRIQRYRQLQQAWQWRYEVASTDKEGTDHDAYAKFKSIQGTMNQVLEALARDLRMQIGKMKEVRSSLSSVNKKLDAAANGTDDLKLHLSNQQRTLEEQLKIYEKNLVTIETSRRVHEKLLDEVNTMVETLSPKAIALSVWYRFDKIWNSEPFAINGQSVKIGDAIKGLAILIIGWMLSRSTSVIFANRFLRRFRLSKDATSAIRSIVFYGLLMFVALSALNTVGVPLTAFTILGGAFAIGIGFGSQTLINNFIGGLIMLAERPVRLGERIVLKDIDGVVEDVGFRCTKIRTQTDHLVTIPNSTLVNESIENVDRRRTIRRQFTIALTYNVSSELLATGVEAIREILEEKEIRERIHPIVGFEELSPRVHFIDFAAESLNVQVTYWYAPVDSAAFAAHTERVNFRIMEELDRLGIDFAFPSKTPYVKNAKATGRRRGDSLAA